ncbi:PREDICTED: protein IQ-DOMAIN 14-like [Camelina sativa]|uniref:Protein IQ-DOMAIN 14-like n=1 Tax=Camelina sativa TaxID=90675 RepID=A0ABM0WCY4_CAMSA|nr:PREDICTED: protein IQ-DOMAIN 14-like [Camelina sativa]XP_010469287.1 PREDICTED: protein IQ-DOMAIN 14-like [Camelina sativa]XP_010469288.1 PREDICTED: protein IQ-DOMAIN 14-like [Camelina sativa]XP_010469289.1 PREDICTED: protein IQ-DOMAIN 14-like [Camelina sativa]
MGKKGSWFSAIKRVFTPHSKEKQLSNNNQEPERKSENKEKKKKGFGKKLRNGETNTFLPIFRQPSSIEKILSDAEREHNLVFRPPSPLTDRAKASSASVPSPSFRTASPKLPSQRYVSSPKPVSPRYASSQAPSPKPPSPKPPSPKPPSPRAVSPRIVQRREFVHRPEPTLLVRNATATKIQAAFRGYMARRSFRALKGLVRLQGVVRGHSVKRQTMNAMKYMQLLVRVQTQVQSRRIQMLENRARNDKDDTKFVSSLMSEDWDDSALTKEEKDARLHRKIDAMIKRERSMAYAYSHQLWKNSPKSAQDIRTSGFPLWWNWVDRQKNQSQPFRLTPTRPSPSPQPQTSNQNHFRLNNSFDISTPNSSKSTYVTPSRPFHTPQPYSSSVSRYSRGGGRATQDSPYKDDDSLTSCPPFSAPSYMAPTVSAKAKLRANSNPKERVDRTPFSTNEKRRSSFPLGSFKWTKGSLFMSSNSNNNNKGPGSSSSSAVVLEKHKTLKSVENLSIDSTVSMPATVGRRAFNRFA